MAGPAYTERFYAGTPPASTYTTLFTVPSGRRWIVLNIDVTGASTGSSLYGFFVSGVTGYFWWASQAGTTGLSQWRGRLAVNQGESLEVLASASTATVYVTGYDLSL